jgi:hypothetical protein
VAALRFLLFPGRRLRRCWMSHRGVVAIAKASMKDQSRYRLGRTMRPITAMTARAPAIRAIARLAVMFCFCWSFVDHWRCPSDEPVPSGCSGAFTLPQAEPFGAGG